MSDDSQIVDKQQENKPKTGFQLYPEHINKAGRPPKGQAMADVILQELLEIDATSGLPKNKLIAKSLILAGIRGDISAIKEINDRIDGKSVQRIEANIVNVDDELDKLETNYDDVARKAKEQMVAVNSSVQSQE